MDQPDRWPPPDATRPRFTPSQQRLVGFILVLAATSVAYRLVAMTDVDETAALCRRAGGPGDRPGPRAPQPVIGDAVGGEPRAVAPPAAGSSAEVSPSLDP
jgi:hypothetical protein